MPELPEVETLLQELLELQLVGETIAGVGIYWPNVAEGIPASSWEKGLKNQKIVSITRRGKFLIFQLTKDRLFVHLRMTGKVHLVSSDEPLQKHEHLRLFFSSGRALSYQDQRKFGRWYLNAPLAELGIEPLTKEFTLDYLQQLLSSHSMQIKPFLLNQKYIAGLGNIYVDEVLWEAKIHPEERTHSLSKKQVEQLHQAIPTILKSAISNKGTSLGKHQSNYRNVSKKEGTHQNLLKIFRKTGNLCPRCNSKIIKIKVAQRGTHLCPFCQKIN